MTEEIIERLEEYLGSEEFEYEAENCSIYLTTALVMLISAMGCLSRNLSRGKTAFMPSPLSSSSSMQFSAEVMRTFSWTPFVADLLCIL